MQPPKLIVCERSGRWARSLRRILANDDIDLVETRSLAECRDELSAAPESFLVVELTPANASAAVDLLAYVDRWHAPARSVVVADREYAALGPAAREAGAIDFVTTPRHLPRTMGAIRRHFARSFARPMSLALTMVQRFVPWN